MRTTSPRVVGLRSFMALIAAGWVLLAACTTPPPGDAANTGAGAPRADAPAGSQQPGAPPPLLGPPPPGASADAQSAAPGVVRSRLVSVPAAKALSDTALAKTDAVQHFRADLFDDVVLSVELRPAQAAGAWAGTVTSDPGGDVTLATSGAATVAEWHLRDGRVFRLRPAGPDVHAIEEINPAQLPNELQPRRRPGGAADAADDPVSPSADPTQIDVLVAYTEAAQTAAGGASAIDLQITNAVTAANTGYTRSSPKQSIRVVHRKLVIYDDTRGYSQALMI